jgi:hypothetical protein
MGKCHRYGCGNAPREHADMNRLLRSPRLSIADRFADAGLWLMAVLNLLAAICFILTVLSL